MYPRPALRPASAPVLPVALSLTTALALVLGGCVPGGGVHGRPGAASLRDPYFPRIGNGGYDVQHYGLTLDYAPESGRLKGTAEITARATQDLSAFNLDLDGLTVDSVTVDGEKAAFHHAGTELTLRPGDDLRRGATFRTVVRYSGAPRRITDPDTSEEGWLRSGERAVGLGEPTGSMAWFPGNHHPSDKASYDIRITVPEGLKAVSNGELRDERTADGHTSFDWHAAEPMASYVAMVAIGPYKTRRTDGTKGTVPVFTAVDPTAARSGARLLKELPAIVKWQEKTFGPYPFSSTGVVIGRPGDSGYALETQNRPFLPGPTSVATLVHEMAHQWFGNSVTPKSWQDMWLSEGFAEYTEWLWTEHTERVPVRQSFADAYDADANWAFPPARPPSAVNISDPPVYGRGAMVLQRVRETVGDAAFFRLVRGWARTHRHGNADTHDFTTYVERESGRDLGDLWDTWLYGEDKPSLE
ncbi:M1 family metallopeptidase [Streptomyces sp. NPDC088182]|uniref:M1 family metallopeptidase n=1 Tax=Streptomyces sp. NPDC088182 TaxID=3365838 RepID=UPI0038302886